MKAHRITVRNKEKRGKPENIQYTHIPKSVRKRMSYQEIQAMRTPSAPEPVQEVPAEPEKTE